MRFRARILADKIPFKFSKFWEKQFDCKKEIFADTERIVADTADPDPEH